MPLEPITLPAMINGTATSTIERPFDQAKDVTCKLKSGSLTVKIDPQAIEIRGGLLVTVESYRLVPGSSEKSFSAITKITITGDSQFNQFELLTP